MNRQDAKRDHTPKPFTSNKHTPFNQSTRKPQKAPHSPKKKPLNPQQSWKTTKASSSTCMSFSPSPSPSLSTHPFHPYLPPPPGATAANPTAAAAGPPLPQLRPAQMLGDEPHHQSQRPRLGANLRRQGRRPRPVHGREPGLRPLRLRARHGRGRRQPQPARAAGRARQERLERELAAVKEGRVGEEERR